MLSESTRIRRRHQSRKLRLLLLKRSLRRLLQHPARHPSPLLQRPSRSLLLLLRNGLLHLAHMHPITQNTRSSTELKPITHGNSRLSLSSPSLSLLLLRNRLQRLPHLLLHQHLLPRLPRSLLPHRLLLLPQLPSLQLSPLMLSSMHMK